MVRDSRLVLPGSSHPRCGSIEIPGSGGIRPNRSIGQLANLFCSDRNNPGSKSLDAGQYARFSGFRTDGFPRRGFFYDCQSVQLLRRLDRRPHGFGDCPGRIHGSIHSLLQPDRLPHRCLRQQRRRLSDSGGGSERQLPGGKCTFRRIRRSLLALHPGEPLGGGSQRPDTCQPPRRAAPGALRPVQFPLGHLWAGFGHQHLPGGLDRPILPGKELRPEPEHPDLRAGLRHSLQALREGSHHLLRPNPSFGRRGLSDQRQQDRQRRL